MTTPVLWLILNFEKTSLRLPGDIVYQALEAGIHGLRSMSRRRTKQPARRRQQAVGRDIEKGHFFEVVTTIVSGSAQASTPLRPASLGARIAAISELYRFFRFTSVTFHHRPADTFASVDTQNNHASVVTFVPGNIAANPTTVLEQMQMPSVSVCMPFDGPHGRLHLTGRKLHGLTQWFNTGQLGDVELDTQGFFFITVASGDTGLARADTCVTWIEYTCEFRDPVPAVVSFSHPSDRGLPGEEAKYTAAGCLGSSPAVFHMPTRVPSHDLVVVPDESPGKDVEAPTTTPNTLLGWVSSKL